MNTENKLNLMVGTVGRLIRRGAVANLRKIFEKSHPVEIADLLRNLPRNERRVAFKALHEHDLVKCSKAVSELGPEVAVRLLEELEVARLERLFAQMTPDDAAGYMDALPDALREDLLATMKAAEKHEVEELLSFPSETAGRIMTPNIFSLQEDVTVGEAISALQNRSDEFEMVFYIYVLDTRNHLVGVVSLRQLLEHPPASRLGEIMTTEVISVRTHTDQEEVARTVANYNLLAVPVLDEENKLVGIVTVDDVIDVIREEATEDIFALAGVDAADRALGDAMESFRRRLPWLIGSLLIAFLISFLVISPFRTYLEADVTLAVLLPLVAAMGGHAATQTLTVVVRGISTGEVTSDTRRRAFRKELLVGALNGLVVGLIAAALTFAFFDQAIFLALVVLGALLVLMNVAALFGTLIPITLKRMNLDPAIASSLFVITITDVLGFFAFLGLAAASLTWLKPLVEG